MSDALLGPWPWYVAGPIIGLVVPLLLLLGGQAFGISSSLKHLCAALPAPDRWKPEYLRYEWRRVGGWNLALVLGVLLGGFLSVALIGTPDTGQSISEATREDLSALGLMEFSGLLPTEIFSWQGLLSPAGFLLIVGGGFLVGFGARYASGCTSGHAISGIANLQIASLVAVIGFFAGGLVATFALLPRILG
jgi:uncharacterized protein